MNVQDRLSLFSERLKKFKLMRVTRFEMGWSYFSLVISLTNWWHLRKENKDKNNNKKQ